MSHCNCHQEMISDGSGRLSRYLKALDPAYAPVDDRSLEELLVFIQEYATRIRFYDVPESNIEDSVPAEKVSWENFFKKDMAVIAASIGVTDTSQIKESYEVVRASLEASPDSKKLGELLAASIALATKINGWYLLAIPVNPLFSDLDVAVHSVLSGQLKRIIAYEEGYKLINAQKPLNLDYGDLDNNELWGTNQPVNADASVYEGNNLEEKILNAALYADEIFDNFFTVMQDLAAKSDGYLRFALEQYPAHQPHMALFIAFLKLFQLAQQQMNGLTGKLLDYYYKDVLQLTAKAALPDKVHVVFELAKHVTEYDLTRDTVLKAGKDVSGIDQFYATDDELVINQAKVKEIKTVFIEKTATEDGDKHIKTIYGNPVANSADGNGKLFAKQDVSKWNTFGGNAGIDIPPDRICRAIQQLSEEAPVRNYAMPGFAIASPQLVLGGGNRLIRMASDGMSELIEQLKQSGSVNPLEIWMSAAQGWLKINTKIEEKEIGEILENDSFNASSEINTPVYGFLANDLVLFLPLSAAPIVAFDADVHQGYSYRTSQPVMQVMLNPEFDFPEALYSSLAFTNFSIRVKVGSIGSGKMGPQMDGLQSLILQNDEQALPIGKAINPFTYSAGTGKSFYIGSEEVFNKTLKQLSINIRSTVDDVSRTVNLFMLRNKQWIQLKENKDKATFTYADLSQGVLEDYMEANGSGTLDRHPIVKLTAWDPSVQKGFMRLDNQTTFRGGEFPEQLTPQELAARFEIKEVSISYTADLPALEEGTDQFFHVYPFGVIEVGLHDNATDEVYEMDEEPNEAGRPVLHSAITEIKRDPRRGRKIYSGDTAASALHVVNAGNKLLPQFTFSGLYDVQSGRDAETLNRIAGRSKIKTPKLLNALSQLSPGRNSLNQYSGNIQEEGMLCIGLEGAKPLQSLSMLFQFAEGSAGNEDDDPPQIHWSYLSQNQWIPLPGENLISDGTYGFQTTGIIKISIPQNATDDDTIITSGLHWLRASVTENADRIPMLINIVTQAVLAVFQDNQNSPAHYDEALEAGSISKLKIPVSDVSKVIQPFASFDGKHKEMGKEFYTRVSERLRHKQRAVTAWDYEHLILDRFPSVYKIKCITHTDPNCLCRHTTDNNGNDTICCGPQIAPGHVLLVPIADLKNRNGVDPLQPKTARRVLIEMVDYIKNLTSPFVKVYAKNPVYEQIIVFFRVKFITGTDIGFYLKKLNDEIVRYLTPWAFDGEVDVVFGQKVYASSIINFIEERSYVDFITDFEMGICKKDCCPPVSHEGSDNHDSAADTISGFSNCQDVETFLTDNVEGSGEIVAVPSTARSILVSAPRHIIIPYEAPPVATPCEQRKLQHVAQDNLAIDVTGNKVSQNNIVMHKATPATPVTEVKVDRIKSTIKVNKEITVKKAAAKEAISKPKTTTKKTTVKKKKAPVKASDVKNKKSDKSG